MILSVYMPHGGYDEEDHVAELELVKVIMEEGKKIGISSSAVSSTWNSNMRVVARISGLTALIGVVLCGPGCRGGGENVVTYEKNCAGYSFSTSW